MTPDEELLRRNIEVWACNWETAIADGACKRPTEIERLAARLKDPVLAHWVLDRSAPATILRDMENVRLYLKIGNLAHALEIKNSFEKDRQYLMQLLNQRYLVTGHRQLDKENKGGPPPNSTLTRDMEMAREFSSRRQSATRSATHLKIVVGKAYGLKRSQAIAAVNNGLQKLSGKEAKSDK